MAAQSKKAALLRVLAAEGESDNRLLRYEQLALIDFVECCGLARDGYETLEMIAATQPDVVLLDMELPMLDGMNVLRRYAENPSEHRPRFLLHSLFANDTLAAEAQKLGAAYLLTRPFETESLAYWLRLMPTWDTPTCASSDPLSETALSQYLLRLGIPSKFDGHRYCKRVLLMRLKNPGEKLKYGALYEAAGDYPKCSHNVSRFIGTAIERAFAKPNEMLKGMLRFGCCEDVEILPNAAFLTLAAEYYAGLYLHKT